MEDDTVPRSRMSGETRTAISTWDRMLVRRAPTRGGTSIGTRDRRSSTIRKVIRHAKASQAIGRGPGAHGGDSIRVAIADDSYLIREALAELIGSADGVEIIASVEDGDALRSVVETEHPDVAIVDIRMPPSGDNEGIELAQGLRGTHPDVGVIVLQPVRRAGLRHRAARGRR